MFINTLRTRISSNILVKYVSKSVYPIINHRYYSDKSNTDQTIQNDTDTFKPRRACMYVPGDDEKKLLKIPKLEADCIILDCEDGVSINRKVEARELINKHLGLLPAEVFSRRDVVVRINSASSGLADDDMKVVLEAARLPNTLMLPKVEDAEHLDWLAGQMSSYVKDRFLNLIILVESAKGLMNLQAVCSRANELSEMGAPFRLTSVVFGSDDFSADIGAIRSEDSKELLFARQSLVTIAKAFKLQAIDLVDNDFKDPEGLEKRSLESFHMGFTGKQVIHPNQVAIVQKSYSPSEERIEWAKELIAEFNISTENGKGAFTFKGVMIDAPLVLQAKNVLRMAEDQTQTQPKSKPKD